jgi:hypothetical protein
VNFIAELEPVLAINGGLQVIVVIMMFVKRDAEAYVLGWVAQLINFGPKIFAVQRGQDLVRHVVVVVNP